MGGGVVGGGLVGGGCGRRYWVQYWGCSMVGLKQRI